LIEAERMAAMGQTVAGIAHAIKNITSGLTGGMFVLEKGIELENWEYLTNGWKLVSGNVEKIKRLALDLLNYCRDREPEYELCDPNRPAKEVFDLMQPRALEQGVELRAELSEALPKTCLDPEAIHRALLNLVSNAIDACTDFINPTEDGEVVIRTYKPRGWAVEYVVEDNGCGMDQETQEKVFHTFFSSKGSKGTGLGLMITKKIVEEHGGVIEMTSKKSEGSIFRIRLPDKKEA
jgi:signal transduction histidine kinase